MGIRKTELLYKKGKKWLKSVYIMKRIFYDFKSYSSYGSGGYWKFNKQRIYNIIIALGLIIVIILLLQKYL
jgi:hypothetical protein